MRKTTGIDLNPVQGQWGILAQVVLGEIRFAVSRHIENSAIHKVPSASQIIDSIEFRPTS
jgi:hypothetical protein